VIPIRVPSIVEALYAVEQVFVRDTSLRLRGITVDPMTFDRLELELSKRFGREAYPSLKAPSGKRWIILFDIKISEE
jgi:hypothetical protein